MAKKVLLKFFETLASDLSLAQPTTEKVSFAVERLKTRARKRARLGDPSLKEKAISDFLATNQKVRDVRLSLDPFIVENARDFLWKTLVNYTTKVSGCIQTPLDLDIIFDSWKFGPGTSVGTEFTHAAQKISSSWAVTPRCQELVVSLRRRNHYLSQFDSEVDWGFHVVNGSCLLTVPKNDETERTIAKEPSGNMTLQLAAASYLEGALSSIGLKLSDQQPKNRLLASLGSKTDGFATIDLSKASDMFSIRLVQALWPPEWFWFFTQVRSENIKTPDGRYIKMHMISTMGNGFTFPMMTLTICALLYALRLSRGGPINYIDWTTAAVFGDDIICRSNEYQAMVKVLEGAGLIVNHDKSFSDGPFRESCGGDYYKGEVVTPFYVKDLSTDSEIYVAINKILDWCTEHNLVLWRTLKFLKSLLRKGPYVVPEWENPDSGILSSQSPHRYKLLAPVVRRCRLVQHDFLVPLACGGYIEAVGGNPFFVPRDKAPKYRVTSKRYPKGYLSSWDPQKGSQERSKFRSMVVDLI